MVKIDLTRNEYIQKTKDRIEYFKGIGDKSIDLEAYTAISIIDDINNYIGVANLFVSDKLDIQLALNEVKKIIINKFVIDMEVRKNGK